MAQKVDIAYRAKAKSEPLNQRFKDITGPAVLRGFRLELGTSSYTLSVMRAEYTSSVAITPNGVRVEETTDLMDILSVEPNINTSGSPRVDSVYLVYQFGPNATAATYVVVKGGDVAAPNPNPLTHLLLGYVNVRPNSYPLQSADLDSVPYGFSSLAVAGNAKFGGETSFDGEVTFNGPVTFMDGTTGGSGGGGGGDSAFIERLPAPIIAEAGQQVFNLPFEYTQNKNAVFVFKDGKEIYPDEFQEYSSTSIRFNDPLNGGESVWVYAYKGINLYDPADHNHDDLYYRKWEVANRAVRFVVDYFNGSAGRTVKHFLGHTSYVVVSIVPVEKTADVGNISVEKRADEIVVYNTGTYKGKFDLTYMLQSPYEYTPTNEDVGLLNSEASGEDAQQKLYTVVNHKRKDGTLYLKTTLSTPNVNGKYTRLTLDYYNSTGTAIIKTVTYALNYDARGTIISKTIV